MLSRIHKKTTKTVEDGFNTYLGYSQYVSWCTNVWFMFMHVDVTIGYMTFLPSNCVYVRYCLRESQSSPREAEVESVKRK